MKIHLYTSIILTTLLLVSCSTNKELITKNNTEFGITKYYVENDNNVKRILTVVNNMTYYSFSPDKIIKQNKKDKGLIYTLVFDKDLNDSKYFQKLSKMDSLVFLETDKILESRNWNKYKNWK